MYICKASMESLSAVMDIYAAAREYMQESGNPHQWGKAYPSHATVEEDIKKEQLYLCIDGSTIAGVFVYFEGEEPTYRIIEDGEWECPEAPYGVMHRVAVSRHGCGVAAFCFAWCFARCKNLRIDTHRDNRPMQSALQKNGFVRRGIIHLANGAERIAYQKTKQEGDKIPLDLCYNL